MHEKKILSEMINGLLTELFINCSNSLDSLPQAAWKKGATARSLLTFRIQICHEVEISTKSVS